MDITKGLEQTFQDGKDQAASAVASATTTPLNVEFPPNKLLELVAKGLAVEKDEMLRGVSSTTLFDSSMASAHGSVPAPRVVSMDFSAVHDVKGASKSFPKHETRQISEHKNVARCARFSPDGRFFATGSADTSIKLFEVSKVVQMMFPDQRDGAHMPPGFQTYYDSLDPITDLVSHPHNTTILSGAKDLTINAVLDVKGASKSFPKHETWNISEHKVSKVKQMMLPDQRDGAHMPPGFQTYYDSLDSINDLVFHTRNSILVSGARDCTIKFFDFSKALTRKAFKIIQDTHNVRSLSFHPSGEFLLAGTDHPIAHLYDVNTFQCCPSANVQETSNGAINQVRYSSTGGIYVTASKDGAVRLWDGVTSQCVRSILGAHGTAEATSATFTKDQKYVLSSGKDSMVNLWEVGTGRLVKQYPGATHTQLRSQAVFSKTEEFVLSIDELSNEIVIWDALTAEQVARWPSNHVGSPRWLEHSPVEESFVTSGTDGSIRFWKEA
ncbi:Cleavage stimulation factor subunit 50 [Salvia divinorum]|uniref:Cleavage stimulation factor 50 kDa subunit n=2 Tax=Magnoliopsida TaxID=3398 RepID=A0ABD1IFS5_SALDI